MKPTSSFILSFALLLAVSPLFAQQKLPVLKADTTRLSYRIGDEFHDHDWAISPRLRPDVLEVLVKDKPIRVSFISPFDSIGFTVEGGRNYDFIVLQNGSKDTAFTRIKAVKYVKPAVFSKEYIRQNDQKTSVEITPVYELINILYALTPTGKKDENIVYRKNVYYQEVINWFGGYTGSDLVRQIDSALQMEHYYLLKMDAYAFDMNNGKIRQSPVYDRVAWGDTNALRPYIPAMEKFARESRFDEFFAIHKAFYDGQVSCYRDSINTGAMVKWLRRNFPQTSYNSFKIIFSPLVSWNQSANWFSDNGFKEAQAHVNFPYISPEARKNWSDKALLLSRGNIVFTEINHSFINPEARQYFDTPDFQKAFNKLDSWIDTTKAAKNYADAEACFNEYMNWALVSLYAMDHAPKDELQKMIASNGENIQERRGFKKFKAFNQYITGLYASKPGGQTLASLYPAIIRWFADNV